MTQFLQLAYRVEDLPGPDRAVDADIARAIGWTTAPHPDKSWHDDIWLQPDGCRGDLPAFTRLIDAALTILPPLDDMLRPLTISMHVSENGERFHAVIKNWSWGQVGSGTRCRNYAIALASAALHAKASALTGKERS